MRTKILAAVLIVAAIGAMIGLFAVTRMSQLNVRTGEVYRYNLQLAATGQLRNAFNRTRINSLDRILARDDAARATGAEALKTSEVEAAAAIAAYKAFNVEPGRAQELAAFEDSWKQYITVVQEKIVPLSDRGDLAAIAKVRKEQVTPLLNSMRDNLDALAEITVARSATAKQEARDTYDSARMLVLMLIICATALGVTLALFVASLIVGPLRRVSDVLRAVATGDLTQTVNLSSRDEIGMMATALDEANRRTRETITAVAGNATALSSSSEEMSSTSNQIASTAEETSAQAQTVSAAAEEISRSVESVAAASEEMGTSIQEIARNANNAAAVAAEAVSIASATNDTVTKLGESSIEIGNVIKTITSIAEQTNLLALNATIEAARAGEAGKGFAVVATEVKELAQETARATEDIASRVEAIQKDTTGAVEAIARISSVIGRISEFQTTIAAAVEEQTATTDETNRNVADASTGVQEIATNITGVADSARLTSEGVHDAQQTSLELARMSSELSALVAKFQY
ncbi:MAG TPA: methyl-accepting chemotaxis protein [Kineosporiaceae bacterium]|nr:methyl-accepting chemotaxis protein [Kineosporiaceae bacterium]